MLKKTVITISIVLIVCIGMLYIISITDYEGITVGMSLDEIYEFLGNKEFYHYYRYIFLTSKWGNPIVVELAYKDFSVSKVYCYSSIWVNTSPFAFKHIKRGMTVPEVTSRVGLPFTSRSSGILSLNYHSKSGDEYVITLHDDENGSCYVQSVKTWEKKE